MADREKVIKELHEARRYLEDKEWSDRGASPHIDAINNALDLLKEEEAVQWINVNDKLPENDGQYLVVYTFFDYKAMGVVRFSHNLHEIDEYIFNTERRPGWYEPDDEVGYFERTTVTHWAKLPEFPKKGR